MSKEGSLAETFVKQFHQQGFNEISWSNFRQSVLRTGGVNNKAAALLLDLLLTVNLTENISLHLEAIADSLEFSDSFARGFNATDVEKINNVLSLDTYLNSTEFEDDAQDAAFSNSVKLRIIRQLKEKCDRYSTIDGFLDLGMSSNKKDSLDLCFAKNNGDSEVFLANLLNNINMNKKLNYSLDLFAKLSKPVPEETAAKKEARITEAKRVLEEVYKAHLEVIKKKSEDLNEKIKKFDDDAPERLKSIEEDLETTQSKLEGNEEDKVLQERLNKLELQKKELPELDKSMKEQFGIQTEIVKKLVKLHETAYKMIGLLLESGQPLDTQTVILQTIFEKIISIIEVPVALIVVGEIKTGKSTIVNKLLGQDLSPHRVEPMTAIPIRYINYRPPKGQGDLEKQVEMVVPFSSQLNKIIRILRNKQGLIEEACRAYGDIKPADGTPAEKSEEDGETQEVSKAPEDAKYPSLWKLSVHVLKLLAEMSKQEFRFKRSYTGRSQVLSVSEQIHDFFRLCVQPTLLDIFTPDGIDLSAELPLNWTQGLDSFLIVSLPLPDFQDASNVVDFSVVDTPGVNESGVEKLKLTDMIVDSANSCHYLAFTISLLALNSTGDYELIQRTVQKFKDTPTIIFGTRVDQVAEGDRDSLKGNILNFVRREENPIPASNIHLISGKMGSIAVQMLKFIKDNGVKPKVISDDESEKKLAKEFSFMVCSGVNEKRKLENYKKMKEDAIVQTCLDLKMESKMEQPLQQMKQVGVSNGIALSLFFTLKNLNQPIQDFITFISRVLENQNRELEKTEKRKKDIDAAVGLLEEKIITIRKNQKNKAEEFVRKAKEELVKMIEDYIRSDELPDLLKGGAKEFKQENKLDTADKLNKDIKACHDTFIKKANEYLSKLSLKFREWSNVLHVELKGDVMDSLNKILTQQIQSPDIPVPDVRLDMDSSEFASRFISQEQRKTAYTSRVKNFFKGEKVQSRQNVVVVDSENIRKEMESMFKSQIEDIVPSLQEKSRRMVNQLVENFFLRAMLYLNSETQILESSKLDEAHLQAVQDGHITLEKDFKNIKELFVKVGHKHSKLVKFEEPSN